MFRRVEMWIFTPENTVKHGRGGIKLKLAFTYSVLNKVERIIKKEWNWHFTEKPVDYVKKSVLCKKHY